MDPCPPGKETDGVEDRCCFFPFEYKGQSYSSCTNVNHDKPWCNLDADGNEWANCGKKKAECGLSS